VRIAPSLTLPDELERARATGELVVFAGAGVSMGAPSHLPSFLKLAREIADPPLPLQTADEQALDRYLGRAERMGVKVQQRAREKLIERGGSHTPLHEHLLSLFSAPTAVRLITTNFDPHFSTAARVVFADAGIPEYVGPALPPGKDFRGIAQLHGSLGNQQDRLVLTDRDFAAAYMTDGWAARFLVGVFASRTVLFVGYSLTDPVMRYLLSAIPATNRWFGLTHGEELSQWADHDIVPVTFETRADGDRFGELNDGMEKWAWYARASISDHDRELRRVIQQGPPSSPEIADYVRARLGTEASLRTFWTEAGDPAWLVWAASEGLLDGIFDRESVTLQDSDVYAWSQWCLTHFAGGENPPLLALVRKKSVRVHAVFAQELASHLLRAGTLPPEPVLRQFIALLVNQPATPRAGGHSPVVHLMGKLVAAGRTLEVLALLRWATVVQLETRDPLYALFGETEEPPVLPTLSPRVALQAPEGELMWFLRERGTALAALVPAEIVALGEQRIADAYQLLELAKGPEDRMDWLSFGRTSIAPSNQDLGAHAEDVLVVLVSCGLLQWREYAPTELLRFAERCSMDERRLLKRLGLYAFGEATAVSPDAVVTRAARERWAGDLWVRPELYHLLKAHYAAASEEAKAEFVAALRDDATWGEIGEYQEQVRFGIGQLLRSLSPESGVTQEFGDAETAAHPDWQTEHVDSDGFLTRVEVGVGGGEASPLEPDEMRGMAPAEAYSRMVTLFDEHGRSETSYALLGAAQQAARADAAWGVRMIAARASGTPGPEAIARSILWGLREASSSLDDQRAMLDAIAGWHWDEELTGPLATVLEQWALSIKGAAEPELLDALDRAADALYDRARTTLSEVGGASGWFEVASTHPAGQAARIWWATANARNWTGGQFVLSITQAERDRWERVLTDLMPGGVYARAMLGFACDRLSNGDGPWAERELFPRFDPASENLIAAPLWDGRLRKQRWSWITVAGLRPYLQRFLLNSATLVPGRGEELGDVVALFVANPADSHFTLSDLRVFVQHGSPEARRAFAEKLPRHLSELMPDARKVLWISVLLPYMRDRRTNVPVALDPEEVVRMLEWPVALPEVAPEVVRELVQIEAPALRDTDHIFWEWRDAENDWVRTHPAEVVAVIKWLADGKSIEPWSASDAVSILETALAAGAPDGDVLAAAEAVAALPFQGAVPLVERLRQRRNT